MRPETEQELAEIVAQATGPVRIIGGGTRDIGKPVFGETLSVAGLSGVQLYEPGALTLVVQAGTPVDEIAALLAGQGQRLGFEPMDYRTLLGTSGTPTIGGVVATNVSGPRRIQVGAARDFALGVRFVDGRGQVLKNGGRVMKNVTGYDLVKLMAGSWGTLGVLSEVALKVMATPEAEATLVMQGLTAKAAISALGDALGSPYDISAAAHIGAGISGAPRTFVRIEGMEASVAYRARALLDGACAGWEQRDSDVSAKIWRDVRDVTAFADQKGVVWRVSVKPSNGPILSDALTAEGLDHKAIYDWGGGLIWLLVNGAKDAGEAIIREKVKTLGGHATLVRASDKQRQEVAVFQPEPALIAALSRQIQQKFDPRGIFNPGLMGL